MENKEEIKEVEEEVVVMEDESRIVSVQKFDTVKCPIDSVTVYNDRAEVTRRLEVKLNGKGIENEGQ